MSRQRLTFVRLTHDVVYVVMAVATVAVFYAGLTGATGPWLSVALALIAAEVAVFVGFGRKCPLAIMARRYGARTGHAFETSLSPRMSRAVFLAIHTIGAIGLTLLVARWVGFLG
jgi:hypothetical protein